MNWIKDQSTGEHQLQLDNGFYAVIPTTVGDWYAGFQNYDDICLEQDSGNDVVYFDSWQAARKWCESQINK